MKTSIWQGSIQGIPHELLVQDKEHLVITLERVQSGPLFEIFSGIKSFANAHPILTGWMIGVGIDAVKKYNEARKKAIKFHAKDLNERSKYLAMIRELEKSGYKVVDHGYTKNGSGYHWELQPK